MSGRLVVTVSLRKQWAFAPPFGNALRCCRIRSGIFELAYDDLEVEKRTSRPLTSTFICSGRYAKRRARRFGTGSVGGLLLSVTRFHLNPETTSAGHGTPMRADSPIF
jgi:hypothetical protein